MKPICAPGAPFAKGASARNSTRLLVAAIFAVLAPVGCLFGPDPVAWPTGVECADTPDDPPPCEGGVCLLLEENKQGMTGLCSAQCASNTDCEGGEHCVLTTVGQACFKVCETDDDCYDAFVCRQVLFGDPSRYCFVDP